jgi:hypothetical protein
MVVRLGVLLRYTLKPALAGNPAGSYHLAVLEPTSEEKILEVGGSDFEVICSVVRWPPSRPLSSNVAVFNSVAEPPHF